MTVKRVYYCDLCRATIDRYARQEGPANPTDMTGYGVHWLSRTDKASGKFRDTLLLAAVNSVEHHICANCFDDIRSIQ